MSDIFVMMHDGESHDVRLRALSYPETVKFMRDMTKRARDAEREEKWARTALAGAKTAKATEAAEERLAKAQDSMIDQSLDLEMEVLGLVEAVDGHSDFMELLTVRTVKAVASATIDFLSGAESTVTISIGSNGSA